jgi:hypothetical protein
MSRPADSHGDWVLWSPGDYSRTQIYVPPALVPHDAALLSRFEVIPVGLPSPAERRESARQIVASALARLGVREVVRGSPGCAVLLAEYAPRVIKRVVERAVAAAVATSRDRIGVDDIEAALGLAPVRERREMRWH